MVGAFGRWFDAKAVQEQARQVRESTIRHQGYTDGHGWGYKRGLEDGYANGYTEGYTKAALAYVLPPKPQRTDFWKLDDKGRTERMIQQDKLRESYMHAVAGDLKYFDAPRRD